MDSKRCMNANCGSSSSSTINSTEWRKGWALRSGEFADLCNNCGSAYDNSMFCDIFHFKESGWRECSSCGKRLHCGCIAARVFVELLDTGGVECISCKKSLRAHTIMADEMPNCTDTTIVINTDGMRATGPPNQTDDSSINKLEPMQCCTDGIGFAHLPHFQKGEASGSLRTMKQEEVTTPSEETEHKYVSDSNKPSNRLTQSTNLDDLRKPFSGKNTSETPMHTNLSTTPGVPSQILYPFPSVLVDQREHSKQFSLINQWPRSHQFFAEPSKSAMDAGLRSDPGAGNIQHQRVARPPAEGRGRSQLLPRYWPRITDQELQQLSGNSNGIIVPLFEKILSASDAGRIGRLVLPKACAEAYFPPISQPEGIPLTIQDVKGKEWVFQFRFWPNNNSRMYVLEGVTPCIQSMLLLAGDTVTFSRIDPEGKILLGFRKASTSVALQTQKGNTNPHINSLSMSTSENSLWHNTERHGSSTLESLMLQSMIVPERKNTRNIGSKSKRLLMDNQDALELKLTWEEVQDMLRPPPSVGVSVVTVEDQEFEEFEEPPVFGKGSIFVIRAFGGQEQWAQCDDCFKWRRLPIDVLLSSRWTCTENIWDPNRCSCSAPDELSPREVENLLRQNQDFKRRKMETTHTQPNQNHESSTPIFDVNSVSSAATTTKHPRHRPGCSCIVCIQPPSGKGKHNPSCTCNVCMTVKRRFKTLMMRKKKRQTDLEAEVSQRQHHISTDDSLLVNVESETDNLAGTSMTRLLQIASFPLETYLDQNGLTSLVSSEKQTSSGSIRPLQESLNDEQHH